VATQRNPGRGWPALGRVSAALVRDRPSRIVPRWEAPQGKGQRSHQDGGEGEAPAAGPRPRRRACARWSDLHRARRRRVMAYSWPHRTPGVDGGQIVVSLLTGARTEELRALTWSHTELDPEPPSVQLWRSVREGGDTKTRLSRRPSNSRTIAQSNFEPTDAGRPRVACATRHDGPTTISSSRRNSAPLSTRPTSGVRSARWPSRLAPN
jgi:hypothetical protein